jgi:hypothetical protein
VNLQYSFQEGTLFVRTPETPVTPAQLFVRTLLEVTSDPTMETLDTFQALVEIISALTLEAASFSEIDDTSHIHSNDESNMLICNVGRSNFYPE